MPRPDTKQLRVMADSFQVNRLTDVIPLDEALGQPSGAFPVTTSPAQRPTAAPAYERPGMGPPASEPEAMAPNPYRQQNMPDIDIGRSSVSPPAPMRYRTTGPTTVLTSTRQRSSAPPEGSSGPWMAALVAIVRRWESRLPSASTSSAIAAPRPNPPPSPPPISVSARACP